MKSEQEVNDQMDYWDKYIHKELDKMPMQEDTLNQFIRIKMAQAQITALQ